METVNNNLSVSTAGSMLMGAGLVMIQNNINTGLILIGVGTVMKIVVALLQKRGVPVEANNG